MRIPLKGSSFGRQYAGWTPSAFAHEGLGCEALTDQQIPVGDGVHLNADVYTPAEPGRYPAVVCFSAYSSEWHTAGIPTGSNEVGSPPFFTDHGYCPVIVERRGMGRSTGEQVVFFDPQDVDDHEKVIAWAAEQPWCNGEVVLFGTSYYALSQPLVAARKPPALKGFFANEMCTDLYRHLVQFGGVPGTYFLALWMGANFTQEQYDKRMSPNKRALISQLTNGPLHGVIEKTVHRKVNRLYSSFMSATPVKAVREMYVNWLFDGKTRATSTIPEGSSPVLDQVEVPFVTVQNLGYFNLHQYGSYDLFENAGTPASSRWLILGPPVYDLPVYEWQGEAVAFFDHILRDLDNGYAAQPRVRYWVNGENAFRAAEDFPPTSGRVRQLFLGSGGEDAATHTLTDSPAATGQNSWAAVPIGVPVLGGLDEVANQMLTFELVATQNTALAGPVTANLSFSCNEIDSYVVARLSRVDRAGKRHQLSMGAIRPAAPTLDSARSTSIEIAIDTDQRVPLVPGEPVTLRFSLTPAPVLLKKGETLRLDLASRTDLLRMDPGQGYAQFDLPVPPYFCRNTVHFGDSSWVEVTEVPVVSASSGTRN